MQLTLWTYEGPPHVGAMRVATAMEGLHYVLHAPQGDTYADLLFTMIERLPKRPPVTYTTFQARDLGGDTAQLFKDAVSNAYERFAPQAMLVGASCTAELIQDDPGGLARALNLPIPVVPLELPAYQKKENWGAAETFYQLVRTLAGPSVPPPGTQRPARAPNTRPRCNILGATALGFRHRDDSREITNLLARLGIDVNVAAPLGATPADIARLGDADFNVVLYPEIATQAAAWLQRSFGQKSTKTVPIGIGATRAFIAEVADLAGIDASAILAQTSGNLPWYSRSVDSTYLTGKRVFIFGDATHAIAAARVATDEMGLQVVGLGTYSREFARDVRDAAKTYGIEALITDDYLEVETRVAELRPELVLGTQMERHISKRLGIACAVISAPVHVQDFPARYSPQMGFEGANVLFDSWVHPLMMGLEEHLVTMFRDDFEFADGAAPSHLGATSEQRAPRAAAEERASDTQVPRTGKSQPSSGTATPKRSSAKFPSSFAARPAGTPRNTPRLTPSRPSRWIRSTMPKPILAADIMTQTTSPLRMVIVTMDSNLAGAAARAAHAIRQTLPDFELTVHPADVWGSDSAALQTCLDDIASGDIVIASMLFLEDHIRAVHAALAARREHCDAMLCFMSAAEVTRLTRMGRFDMSREATGAMAMLKKLRGGKPGAGAAGAAHAQMKMLRRLPKLMKYIPGTAQDVRTYFLALQYWLAGSEENLANLMRMMVERFAAGPHLHMRSAVRAAAPVIYPDIGIYHPSLPGRVAETNADLPRAGQAGTIGLILLRSYILSGNAAHYDGVIKTLEKRGLNVIPVFSSGLDARPAIEKFFFASGVPAVDAVVSLSGFSLVGGPAYNDSRAAEALLARLDVPYITAHPAEFQALDQWESNARGLLPIEATMMVAIPELDGGILPMTFGGRCGRANTNNPCAGCEGGQCARNMVSHPRARRNPRRPRAETRDPAPHRPRRSQDRNGDLQLSAQRRRRRHRRLPGRLRIPVQHAAIPENRRLQRRGSGLRRNPCGKPSSKAMPRRSERMPTSPPASL